LTASAWDSLSLRVQLRRLRRLGRTALTSFGVQDTGLTLLRHEANTTFRVETVAGRFLLRINRPNVHTPETIESEVWKRLPPELAAIAKEFQRKFFPKV